MKDEQNILQLPIPLCASRTDKDCKVLIQCHGLYAYVERFFP